MNDLAIAAGLSDTEAAEAVPDAETVAEEGAEQAQPRETQIEKLLRWADQAKTTNILDDKDPEVAAQIAGLGQKVVEEYRIDLDSRKGWVDDAKTAMDLSLQKAKPKTTPWVNASNVILPMITEAADQFAARAYPAIIDGRDVVKGAVYGPDNGIPQVDPTTRQPVMAVDPGSGQPSPVWRVPPGAKKRRADNIGQHMSWQLLEEQPEWEADTDKMLHILPVVGCEFRKSFFDAVMGRNMSLRISAFNLVVNYWAKSLDLAPRITEELKYYPYEIAEFQRAGLWLDTGSFGPSTEGDANDPDTPHLFLEQHRRIDLDGDGYPEPYTVVVHENTATVVRISARFDADGIRFAATEQGGAVQKIAKISPLQFYTQYDFLPNKEGGLYGFGIGHMLKSLNEAANSTLNAMFDAAKLQNTGGGFIGKGLSLNSGEMRFRVGEWKPVNAAGDDIRKSIVPFEHQGPSPVLFQLLGLLVDAGKNISSVKDVMTGDLKAQTMSPTVFMALVEQGLKVFTAIWKRIRRSLKSEYDKLFRLNRLYLEEQVSYQVGDEVRYVSRADYEKGTGVEPVSDASMIVDAQRMARAQFLQQFMADPFFDPIEIRTRILDAANIQDPEKLIKAPASGPDPMLIAQMAELELKSIEVKARSIASMATALKTLAETDAIVMEPFRTWAEMQIQMMQSRVEALNDQNQNGTPGGTSGATTPGTPGPDLGAGQPMAPAPGNAGLPPLPQGLPGGTAPAASGPMGTGQS